MATRVPRLNRKKPLRALPPARRLVIVAALLMVAATGTQDTAADPIVVVRPESAAVEATAASFQIGVFVDEVTNATGLGGYDLVLRFDPAIVRALSIGDSGFLPSTDNTVTCLPSQIDNTAGQALLSCVTDAPVVGNGPTTTIPELLATAVFEPVATGTSPLVIDGTALTDPSGSPLATTIENSQVTVVPAPPQPSATSTTATAPSPTEPTSPAAAPTSLATATPAGGQAPPETRNGSGDGGSPWVLPLAGGLAGAVAAGFAAGLGLRYWRRRRRGAGRR